MCCRRGFCVFGLPEVVFEVFNIASFPVYLRCVYFVVFVWGYFGFLGFRGCLVA